MITYLKENAELMKGLFKSLLLSGGGLFISINIKEWNMIGVLLGVLLTALSILYTILMIITQIQKMKNNMSNNKKNDKS